MDRLEEMRTFVAIAEEGVTGAAKRLRIAPSAVSRRLKDLETRLGATLMARTTRRMTLTDAGQDFLNDCVSILDQVTAAEARVSEVTIALAGRIRLAAPLSFGISHLQPILNTFMARHPDIILDVDLDDRRVDIHREGYDLVIRIGALEDSSLQSRKLASVPMLVVASEGFIKRHGAPSRLEDLGNLPALCYSPSSRPEIWSCVDEAGQKKAVKVRAQMLSNNGDVLRDAAIAGVGVGLLPEFIISRALGKGQLRPLLPGYVWPKGDVFALWPTRYYLPQRVRRLIDLLARELA